MDQAVIEREFARCWPWLEAALSRGTEANTDARAVLALLHANQAQLWPGDSAAAVTQLLRLPEGRYVHCWLGGGDMAGLLDLRAGIEAWGRMLGAEYASINGRRGWDRLFAPFGYHRVDGELVRAL